ncbi:hypothetical protein LguiA_020469 [Lonicera macranthoides]
MIYIYIYRVPISYAPVPLTKIDAIFLSHFFRSNLLLSLNITKIHFSLSKITTPHFTLSKILHHQTEKSSSSISLSQITTSISLSHQAPSSTIVFHHQAASEMRRGSLLFSLCFLVIS